MEFTGHRANRCAALTQQLDMVALEWAKMSVGPRDSSGGLDVSEHSSYRKGHDAFFLASFLSAERSRSGTTNKNGDAQTMRLKLHPKCCTCSLKPQTLRGLRNCSAFPPKTIIQGSLRRPSQSLQPRAFLRHEIDSVAGGSLLRTKNS